MLESMNAQLAQLQLESDISPFPDEVLEHILAYVPQYRSWGVQSIRRVSKKWNRLIHRASTSVILNGCQDKEDVRAVLSDWSILKHVSWDELFKLMAMDAELAEHIIAQPGVLKIMGFEELSQFILNQKLRETIFLNKSFVRRLWDFKQGDRLKTFMSLPIPAELIPKMLKKYNTEECIHFAHMNKALAVAVLNHKPWISLATIYDIARGHRDCVRVCLKNRYIMGRLRYRSDWLFELVQPFPQILNGLPMDQLLQILKLFESAQLKQLADLNPHCAMVIVTNYELRKQFNKSTLVKWAKDNQSVFETLWADSLFRRLLTVQDYLQLEHKAAAAYVCSVHGTHNLSCAELVKLGQVDGAEALVLLEDTRLTSADIRTMLVPNPTLVRLLLGKEKWQVLFSGDCLAAFGMVDQDNAKIILMTPALSHKLEPGTQLKFATKHRAIAREWLGLQADQDNVNDESIATLLDAHSDLGVEIIGHATLKHKLGQHSFKILLCNNACRLALMKDQALVGKIVELGLIDVWFTEFIALFPEHLDRFDLPDRLLLARKSADIAAIIFAQVQTNIASILMNPDHRQSLYQLCRLYPQYAQLLLRQKVFCMNHPEILIDLSRWYVGALVAIAEDKDYSRLLEDIPTSCIHERMLVLRIVKTHYAVQSTGLDRRRPG